MNYQYLEIEEKVGPYVQIGTRIRRTRDIDFEELGSRGRCFVVGNGTCYVYEKGSFFEYRSESHLRQHNK